MKYFFIEQLHFENIVFLEFILLVLRVLVKFILGFIVAYYVFPSRYLSNINKKSQQVKDEEGNVILPASQNDWERQGKTISPPKIKMHDPSKLGEPGYIPPDGPNKWLIGIAYGHLLVDIINTIINSKVKIPYRLDNNLNKDGTQYENNTKKGK